MGVCESFYRRSIHLAPSPPAHTLAAAAGIAVAADNAAWFDLFTFEL